MYHSIIVSKSEGLTPNSSGDIGSASGLILPRISRLVTWASHSVDTQWFHCFHYLVEDEAGSDCVTIGLDDSDVKDIDKVEVKSMLKELAELKHKEADVLIVWLKLYLI